VGRERVFERGIEMTYFDIWLEMEYITGSVDEPGEKHYPYRESDEWAKDAWLMALKLCYSKYSEKFYQNNPQHFLGFLKDEINQNTKVEDKI